MDNKRDVVRDGSAQDLTAFKEESLPHFSIVVAAHNVENYIAESLDSALTQSYPSKYQVVVVDDGSTDQTGFICDQYASRYADKVTVVHQENRGLYEARKTGVRSSKGKYLVFLDGDDCLRRDSLQRIHEAESSANADVVIFKMCRNTIFERDSTSEFHVPQTNIATKDLSVQDLRRQLLCTDTINNVVTKAVKRTCLLAFSNEMEQKRILMAEDKLISTFILDAASHPVFLDEILYYYRPNDSSIMKSSFSINRYYDLCAVHDALRLRIADWALLSCAEQFDALFLSQTCEEISRLYASRPRQEDLARSLREIRDNPTFVSAFSKRALRSLRFHRRTALRLLNDSDLCKLNLWMLFYNWILHVVRHLRGR